MRLALLFLCCFTLRAEIVDRIAMSIGKQVITEGQIVEGIRLAAFLNREQPNLGKEEKRKAAERMLEQTLIRRDMDLSHFPPPEGAEALKTEALKLERPIRDAYPSEAAFQQDLAKHGITEDELRGHLLWQLTFLRYIDYRFRPSVQVPDSEIKQYYDKKRAEWERAGVTPIPPLAEARDDIEKILTQQRVDQAVDRWLGDARTQVDIVYRPEAFK